MAAAPVEKKSRSPETGNQQQADCCIGAIAKLGKQDCYA
jgi:hypothetical protein